ncbi:MAG: 50S ribosomal protein L21 [Nitrospirae bacterium RBG_19FT_COMBO_42_15]|nr:MAG: 50S ribosomal protein L21 [Nitrospirae bacterium RBG_19FT_COMBO_42_15]
MYAVLETGGKQYKVSQGDVISVEKLSAKPGEKVELNKVLMIGGEKTVIGNPLVKSAKVIGEVVGEGRGDKIIVFKMKRRKNYRRTNGHRQAFTSLKITEIVSAS